MKEKRGQASIEFFILVGAVLFFFLAFLSAVQINLEDKSREKLNLEVKELALAVTDEINLAVKASEGYSRVFVIPEKVANREYDINIIAGLVYIRTTDGKFSLAYPVQEVNGDVIIGENMIRKENGEVYLNS